MATHPLVLLILAASIVAFRLAPCTADDNALNVPANDQINAITSPDSLYARQSLNLLSYRFTMQADCNLVLYDYDNPIWSTDTRGRGSGCRVTMQEDGNLVIYDENGRALWASGSSGKTGSYVLVLQRDRNVVIYEDARWSTRTSRGAIEVANDNVLSAPANSAINAITSPENLYETQSLDVNGYHFTMQTDCNLVLYNNGNPIWASDTGGRGTGCKAIMQEDGNLVIYNDKRNAVWASGSSGSKGSYVLVMQKDGNVVIYGDARWSTSTVGALVALNSTAAAAAEQQVAVNVA